MTKKEILKPYIQEGAMAQVVDVDDCIVAMDIYLKQFADYYNKKMEEYSLHCGIGEDILNGFLNSSSTI